MNLREGSAPQRKFSFGSSDRGKILKPILTQHHEPSIEFSSELSPRKDGGIPRSPSSFFPAYGSSEAEETHNSLSQELKYPSNNVNVRKLFGDNNVDLSNLNLDKIKNVGVKSSIKVKRNPLFGENKLKKKIEKGKEDRLKQSEKVNKLLMLNDIKWEEYQKSFESFDKLTLKLKEERMKEAIKRKAMEENGLEVQKEMFSSEPLKTKVTQEDKVPAVLQRLTIDLPKTKFGKLKSQKSTTTLNPLINIMEKKRMNEVNENNTNSFIASEDSDSGDTSPRSFFNHTALDTTESKLSTEEENTNSLNNVFYRMSLSPRGVNGRIENTNLLYYSKEFENYLHSVYSFEILDFWKQVSEYRSTISNNKRSFLGLNIYHNFIFKQNSNLFGVSEITVNLEVTKRISKNVLSNNFPVDLYDEAYFEVEYQLKSHSYDYLKYRSVSKETPRSSRGSPKYKKKKKFSYQQQVPRFFHRQQ
eukprot:TRINITY_DN1484_c0_g1_i1.p1 TRINITY_DN1484_c0_g1~~TRINITY_DN1484_c0_g1_i1.p1  ORF type:complete len:473 (+),score=154.10 TRINITY_DN1484_c0_g1_i1:1191-2609(+)